MRSASRLGFMALCLGFAGTAAAQDVANGLWQSYRYPASNPNWRRNYEAEVAHWGYDPQGLRPAYRSSPDMMWSNDSPGGATPFGNDPFYTVTRWQPYVPRPIDWSGLEYSGAGAPPENTTGNHGWYGPNSPGPRGATPREWREWEQDTPEGERYLERSGLRGSADRPARNVFGVPGQEKTGLKQYFREAQPKTGAKIWQSRISRMPPDPSEIPAQAQAEDETGGFKHYVLKRAPGAAQARWQAEQAKVLRPKAVAPNLAQSRIITPAPDHSGFTQYSVKIKPGPGQGRLEETSKKPVTEPAPRPPMNESQRINRR